MRADVAVLGEGFAADVAVVGAFACVAAFVGLEVAAMGGLASVKEEVLIGIGDVAYPSWLNFWPQLGARQTKGLQPVWARCDAVS